MTILEYAPSREEMLEFVDNSIRQLRETGHQAKYIVMGPAAYKHMRKAIGERFKRGAGTFETYQHIPIVVDPFREDEVCVVPAPVVCEKEARGVRM